MILGIRHAALASALALLAACDGAASNETTAQNQAATIVDPIAVPPPVAAALADPLRAMHRGADARRHPGEIVAFTGVAAGQRVLDLIPGRRLLDADLQPHRRTGRPGLCRLAGKLRAGRAGQCSDAA